MLRQQRRSPAALIIILFAILPVVGTAAEDNDFEVDVLTATYSGQLAHLIESENARPLSLAAADLDEDGVPDLVVGYGDGATGLFVLHRGNIEAIYPKAGQEAGPAFLPEALVFSTDQRPDHIATGDFDADGHFDVVTAATGGGTLVLHRGSGDGRFAAAESIELGGRLTAMAAGEVNRRDGLTDLVVGVDGWDRSHLLVFEWPEGALRGSPERIDTELVIESIYFGRYDDDGYRDIVATNGSEAVVTLGRDRRLSRGRQARSSVPPPTLIRNLSESEALAPIEDVKSTGAGGTGLASMEMRLNRDAVPDAVLITEDSSSPLVVKTRSRATFTVDSTADNADFDTGDGVCDTDDSVGDGPCTLRAAIQQANASSGADAVEFDIPGTGPHTIQPISALPTITEAATIDGYTQPGASANTVAFPGGLDSVLQIELDGSAAVAPLNGIVLGAQNCVVRGLVINRMQRSSGTDAGSGLFIDADGASIIEGNFIGTDPTGTTALQNEFYGILGWRGAGTVYGGTAAPARNLISGQGVNFAHREGNGAFIQGNYIGTDVSGTISLDQNNHKGIFLFSRENYGSPPGDDHTVGGTAAGAGNLVSGLHTGIQLDRDTSGNLIQGNYIGPDSGGSTALGFASYGVEILWNENNTVGGTSPAARNVISGSGVSGSIGLYAQESPGTLVQGNYVGTDVAGTSGHPFETGIDIGQLTPGTTVGGAVAGAGNLASGNLDTGVRIRSTSNVSVLGNTIGTSSTGSPLGNSLTGVVVWVSDHITIGGAGPGEGNDIAHSGGTGVAIGTGDAWAVSDPGIRVVGNSIHSNTLLGIDLEDDGVTPNDLGDADTGSNGLQNFPVISSVAAGGTQVTGTLNSLPSTQYELAFYSNTTCDLSGHGEGETFLGIDTVTTDGAGDAAFTSNLTTAAPAGSYVTATATDPNGSTSEFSACFVLTAQADLAITKDDGTTSVIAGRQVTYTIVASNPTGPDDAVGVSVADTFPPELDCVWTCIGSGSATCTAGPVVGDIDDDAVFLPVGGAVTYTAVCDLALSATGSLSNTATVAPPPAVTDPNSANNSATDVDTVQQLDFGDAPDPTMPTLLASDGARHVIGGSLFLGSSVDPDGDGQPTTNADGDDVTGTDDEDGIVFTTSVLTGYNADIEVTASGAGLLNAWLDFNGDGDWNDAGEQIFTDQAVGAGINPFSIPVPVSAATGDSYSRFRLASAGGLAPTGLGADGEVEDHFVEVRFSTLDVAETGQTTSYGAGDDGAYQAGEPWPDPRFTDNGDGTITDGLTGLTWAQDSVNPGPAPCNPGVTRNWFLSLDYVDCLNTNSWLGHSDWRMPNIVELGSLVHYGVAGDHRPWWNSQGFTMTTNYRWWSSTNQPDGLSVVWSLSAVASFAGYGKLAVTGTAVWPVRGGGLAEGAIRLPQTGQERCWDDSYTQVPCAGTGQDGDHRAGAEWPLPRFEASGDCVTDRLTGLTWSRDTDLFGQRSWTDALADTLNLSLCGFDDWRLPSNLELQTLTHFDKRRDYLSPSLAEWWESQGFTNVSSGASWSSTSVAEAPAVFAWNGWSTQNKDSDDSVKVWPVRGGSQTDTADLSVLISDATDPVNVGDAVVYTVELANLGPSTASEITVTTTLPAGSTFVAASGSGWACGELDLVVTCDMPTLAVAAAPPITLEITTPPSFGTITAVAIADSLNDDPIGDNNGDSESTTVIAYDFGDAPDPSYPTLAASSGAVHIIGGGLFLGAAVDDEPDGQPTANADGDDNDGSDDEDGVVLPVAFLAGAEEPVDVTASAAGLLNAWIDFNADGDWDDPGEQVYTDEALAAGVNNLNLTVPLDAAVGATFARFRFDSAGGLTPTGLAADGEVEDYTIEILPSADLEVVIGDSPDPVPEGGLLTYFLTVTNNGQLDAADAVLEQTLPVEGSFTSASHGGCSETGGVVTCDLGTISTGATVEVEVGFIVDFGAVGMITSTASVQTTDPDPITTNNADTETTSVVDEPTYIFSDGFETGDTGRWSATSP